MFPNLRLLFLGFFIVVQEINYPSCFIVKQKKCGISLFRRSHSRPSPSRVSVRVYSSFVDTSENNAKKFVGTTGESLHPVGGTGWYMDFVTNHSKPASIGQKHSLSCELLKVGCDQLFRQQTTVETTDNRIYREVSPWTSLRLFLFSYDQSSSLSCHGGRQDFDL